MLSALGTCMPFMYCFSINLAKRVAPMVSSSPVRYSLDGSGFAAGLDVSPSSTAVHRGSGRGDGGDPWGAGARVGSRRATPRGWGGMDTPWPRLVGEK